MKNNCVIRNSVAVLILYMVLFQGCYQAVPGCLDAQATNYAVDADEPCPDACCTYPSIKLKIQHCYEVAPDSFISLNYGDSIYFDALGEPFRISGIQYYMSAFKLVKTDGSLIGVSDSLTVNQIDPLSGDTSALTLEDNFLLLNPVLKEVNITLGNFREVATFSGIQFQLGLNGPANYTNPASVDDNHPLSIQADNMYISPEEGYIFHKVGLFADTLATDTIPVITEISGISNLRDVVLPIVFTTNNGFDVTISIQVNYKRWFEGIDIQNSLNNDLEQQLIANIPSSFSVIEVN